MKRGFLKSEKAQKSLSLSDAAPVVSTTTTKAAATTAKLMQVSPTTTTQTDNKISAELLAKAPWLGIPTQRVGGYRIGLV